jgi:YegS/Rv2252/BmrU family lipid kinase
MMSTAPVKVVVLLNASAGALATEEPLAQVARVRAAFEQAGLAAEVRSVAHDRLGEAAESAASSAAEVVAVGGGDGTVNTVASALLDRGKPLGVLPLGTLNHFAKDLGLPLELEKAVETIAAGNVREVDVGEVNGRIFLNNSSIGLYPSAVDGREELRHRAGLGKWRAMLHASLTVFRRFPVLGVTVRTDDRTVSFDTPFIFVGNNRYEMSLFSLGRRASLEGGELSVYTSGAGGRMGLVRLALRALLGRLDQDRDFRVLLVPEMQIETRRRSLRVSLDGEVVALPSPIRYRTRPRALRVLAPPEAAPEKA